MDYYYSSSKAFYAYEQDTRMMSLNAFYDFCQLLKEVFVAAILLVELCGFNRPALFDFES